MTEGTGRAARSLGAHTAFRRPRVSRKLLTVKFEWDPKKANANLEKHGVTFEEASTAFADWDSITVPDPEHSVG